MNWRNRIVGGIALGFGLSIIVLLMIDARWDNHDTIKPLKTLFGGLAFIGLGAWYLIRSAKAEPWKGTEIALNQGVPEETERLDIGSTLAELESLPSFQTQCQKVEADMRERAAKMDKVLESECKDKA